ncbi:MAG: ATP synthase subunit I [Burkholderiaceae bacterium]
MLSQVGGTVVIALLAGFLKGWPVGRSVALGGMAVFLPAALSALRIGLGRSDTPQAALRTQVSAQTLKLLCTVCVFGGIFLLDKQVHALGVFLGFGAVHLAYWLALLLER